MGRKAREEGPVAHLTPDEIELLLEQALPVTRVAHLDACPTCAREARETIALARGMATLPSLAPAPGFADRVLARLRSPAPAAVPAATVPRRWLPTRRRAWALAAAFAGLSLISTGVAAMLLGSWPPAVAAADTLLVEGLRLFAAARETITTQLGSIPWAKVAALLATEPLRLAAFALLAVTSYATLLVALWSLTRPPRRGYAPST